MSLFFLFFFFNDTATTEIYTLSLHDALPICKDFHTETGPSRTIAYAAFFHSTAGTYPRSSRACCTSRANSRSSSSVLRSEEHTSELQSRSDLVCRLLLEKKKKTMMCDYKFNT